MTLRSDLEKALADEAYDGGLGALSETQFARLVARLAETAVEVFNDRPEGSEWEYRAVASEPDTGDVYDSTRPASSAGEALDIAAACRLLESNPDLPALVVSAQRRRKAGPWMPVGEGESSV